MTFATAGVVRHRLGNGAELSLCEWDGDRCVRVRTFRDANRNRWNGEQRVAEYDERGLLVIRAGLVFDEDDASAALDTEPLDLVRWDRRVDAYEAEPIPPQQAIEAWWRAVAVAAHRG